ncbi:MAG: Rpn family recombination-promoting nuclease/putative transposase [Desulfobacterales bacterium]|nr:Rpn family recombination-promoting nuclease/putative transposase [Desulfobacterales bacterium]MBF0397919.1 Rpn family recombination-promoting nuclease/putative transposase [Desulfobacterales bacterium]
MRFVDPKSNIAFKKIFGNENKKEILISFLNAVLMLEGDKAIKEVTILDPYQAPKIKDLKETILDVRAKDGRGITFIIEMQVERQRLFHKRILYYTSKAYVSQIEKAIDYPKLNQIFFIGILNFKMFENEDYISRHLILDKKTYKQEIKDFEFNFIELKKFNKELTELENVIDKWIYFFKYAEDLRIVPVQLSNVKEIVEAFEVVEQYNWTKEELDVYEFWQMEETKQRDIIETAIIDAKIEAELAIKDAEVKAEAKGRMDEKKDTVKNLLSLGVDIQTIIKATGLDEEIIISLGG